MGPPVSPNITDRQSVSRQKTAPERPLGKPKRAELSTGQAECCWREPPPGCERPRERKIEMKPIRHSKNDRGLSDHHAIAKPQHPRKRQIGREIRSDICRLAATLVRDLDPGWALEWSSFCHPTQASFGSMRHFAADSRRQSCSNPAPSERSFDYIPFGLMGPLLRGNVQVGVNAH